MAESESSRIDPDQKHKAREILHVLVNAVSAAKLFPSDHQTVLNFIVDLHKRLDKFLEENWKLELGIEEHAFTLGEEVLYEDPHPVKSLPFFFFKDGMQKLYFYKGLSKEELKGFLDTVRAVSQLPPEEGDIVNALWEKDFANIRYLAPDDFLETKIGVGRPPLRPAVDRIALEHGRIELSPEDRDEIGQAVASLERTLEPEVRTADRPGFDNALSPAPLTDDKDMAAVDALLQSSRQASPEDEYLTLVIELIYLEDRPDQFPVIVEVIEQYYREIMSRKDFAKAAALLGSLSEIRDRFAKLDTPKSELIGSAVGLLSQKGVLIDLKETLDLSSVKDMEGLFAYLGLFGSRAAGLLADIYERVRSSEWRQTVLQMLTKIGQDDFQALGSLIQESRPSVSQEVIRLFREGPDKRSATFLANVVSYKNPAIKQAAIRALGEASDGAANKILLGFLSDGDESIRIAALDNIVKVEDKSIIAHINGLICEKTFARKSAHEKKALFDVLGRSDSEEACGFLGAILRKVPFLPKPGNTELSLYAVSTLAGMKHPQSLELLKIGAKRRHWKIRHACLEALQARSKIRVTFTGRIPQ